jgi:hypothetical protein
MQKQTDKKNGAVINFMGGKSFKLNPLETLKMIAASSIFGEPSYYRTDSKVRDSKFTTESTHVIPIEDRILDTRYDGLTTTEIFEQAIDAALDYDFEATLKLAVDLRKNYFMRLNPQVIAVRAALHSKRVEFSKKHPMLFRRYESLIMGRADEPATQVTYYLYLKGDKAKMPSILKRSIADKLASLSRYEVSKYKNAEIGMINAVRITHAFSPVLNELMRTGTIEVSEDEETWERLRSNGMDWRTIAIEYVINKKRAGQKPLLGHMALLRNLRNIFQDLQDPADAEYASELLEILKDGVKYGKQFPFRYDSAYKVIMKEDVNFKIRILDALEECIDISIDNLPHLKGKTIALSDNSGSAWGALTTEYGSTQIAEIDNLSSVIAAMASVEGYVGKFGDRLEVSGISKRNGALMQTGRLNADRGRGVGHNTEAGIWHFFRDAIDSMTWYDNIFIFSDMQAGTGQLYGDDRDHMEYKSMGYGCDLVKPFGRIQDRMIDVYKLIQAYRSKVNSAVNVFCVQTAGYNNVILPIMTYRTAMLTGWTGKEILYAAEYIRQWDEIEASRSNKSTNNSL